MGQGQSREESEAEAQVQQQQLQIEEERREKERARLEELLREHDKQRTEARIAENIRIADEQKRADEQRLEIAKRHAEARAREQEREEAAQAANSAQAQRAVETNTQLLNALSNANQQAVANATTNHQSGVRDTMTKIAQEQKEAREAVLGLKEQKEKKQDELHKEKEGYIDKKREEAKDHQEKVMAAEFRKIEIIKKQTAISMEHENKMLCIEKTFALQKEVIHLASEDDRNEINLIDAVHLVRQAGNRLSNHTVHIAIVEYFSSRKIPITPKIIKATMTACQKSYDCLTILEENVTAILEQQESKHPKTTECQSVAREIAGLANELRQFLLHLLQLPGSDILPEQMTPVCKDIKTCSENLQRKVIDLPVVSKSDHTVQAISASMRALTETGRLNPKETEQPKALED